MKLHIENIARIKKTDINIDGITIIAGSNNTGKSTVGKALFAMFEAFYSLEEFVNDWKPRDAEDILKKWGDNLDFICKNLANVKRRKTTSSHNLQTIYIRNLAESKKTEEIRMILENYCIKHLELYDIQEQFENEKVQNWLNEAVLNISDVMLDYNSEYAEKVGIKNVFLNVFGEQISKRHKKNGDKQSIIKSKVSIEVQSLDIKSVNEVFIENDDVKLVNQNFKVDTKAIYIKTPETLDNFAFIEQYQSPLRQKQFIEEKLSPYGVKMDYAMELFPRFGRYYGYYGGYKKDIKSIDSMESNAEMQKMDAIIKDINEEMVNLMGGSLEFKTNEGTFFNDNDYIETFKLNNLSTGLKAISLLQCILHYRVLKEKSVLILDEPEINLHPEWQAAYARYIVLLQKKLNLHIVITTHSPFFLKAIEKASEEYDIFEKCHYYYAHNDEGDAVIECVDENMEEIYSKMMMPLLSMMNDMGL